MKLRHKRILLASIFILVITLSCALPTGLRDWIRDTVVDTMETTPTTQSITETVAETSQTLDLEKPTETETPADTPTAPADLEGVVTALTGDEANLPDTYRTTFSMTSKGAGPSGDEYIQNVETESEYNRPAGLQHSSVNYDGSGTFSHTDRFELYRHGELLVVYTPDNATAPCTPISGLEEQMSDLLLIPESFIQSVKIGELLESNVTVNEIAADLYTVETAGLQTNAAVFEDGEVWIARDGGYVVRFTGTAKSDDGSQQSAASAEVEWVYNLLDAEQMNDIALPAECLNPQQAVNDIPLPNSAVNQQSFGGIVTFTTPDQPEDTANFYRQALPPLGWEITDDLDTGGVIMLTAQKDDLDLQVMITPENNGSSVILTTISLK